MSFITKPYWIGFIAIIIILWLLPARYRKGWLLLVSYAFYSVWSIPYCALLFGMGAVNHFGAKWMVAPGGDRKRRAKYVIAANLLVLGVFKYLAWLLGLFGSAATLLGAQLSLPIPKWALPLGISFYLFEAISYIVDVSRKREKVHAFWDFQLFMAFFPKLIAGPILRAKELLPQLEDGQLRLKPSDVRLALRQIALGLFVKLLLADTVGGMVDSQLARVAHEGTSLDAWVLGIGACLQFYLDISAYTRLAIGCAKLCGVDLVENFDHPLISTSPAEFWRRYHMSLSRWVRDYLFFPLARPGKLEGSPERVKLIRRMILVRAAFVSMFIFGVWHGASFNWLLYGTFHGIVLAGYHVITDLFGGEQKGEASSESNPRSLRAIAIPLVGWAITMSTEFLGSMVGRAQSIQDALRLVGRAVRPFTFPGRTIPDYMLFRIVLFFFVLVGIGYFARRRGEAQKASLDTAPKPKMVEFGFLGSALEGVGLGILLVLALLEMTGKDATFIYFQF